MPNTPGSRAVATHRSVSGIALALVLACLVAPVSLGAQGRLLERVTVRGGAVYENWSFPTAIAATAADGSAENVAGGSQLTIPGGVIDFSGGTSPAKAKVSIVLSQQQSDGSSH